MFRLSLAWLYSFRLGLVSSFAVVALLFLGGSAPALSATMQGGVDLAGLDFGSTYPGRLNFDYVQPTIAELDYYHSKGLNLIRLPVRWERLQPNLYAVHPDAALDQHYLRLITQVIGWAGRRGMKVIVDIHNYGGYGTHKLGDPTLPVALFPAFWGRLASKLAGEPGLAGYDLMNEPNGMPQPVLWPVAAQHAVDVIRQVDRSAAIYVEGYFYAAAVDWLTYNAKLSIKDSANNLIYQAHVYGDRDNSGSHMDWTTEASFGVTVNTIAQRVAIFTTWCQQRAVRCMFGEVGVPNTDPNWNTELANGLAAMKAGGILNFTYWAGGPWWGSYPLSIEPQPLTGQTGDAATMADAVQMSVVDLYAQP